MDKLETILKGQEYFIVLARDYPVIAAIVVLGVLAIGANLIFSQIAEFRKIFQSQWIRSRTAKIGLPVVFIGAAILSMEVVQIVRESIEPVPKMEPPSTATFISQPIRLQWVYERPAPNFEIQSSKNISFSQDVRPEGYWPGNFIQIEREVNDVRYWRVRAVNSDNEKISGWSYPPIRIAHYDSNLMRIKKTGYVNVYMSDSFNEAFFKFKAKDVRSPPRGYDVAVIREIVKRLPAHLGIDTPLSHGPIHVTWTKLLNAPTEGLADIIISTITASPGREAEFKIRFSKPYYCTTYSVMHRPPRSTQPIPQIIANKRVGAQERTTSEKLLNQFILEDKSIKPVNEKQPSDTGSNLVNNRTDYGITDTQFALAEQRRYASPLEVRELINPEDFPTVTTLEERVQKYAVAVRLEEEELIEAINKIIDEMRAKMLGELLEDSVKEFYSDRVKPGNAPVVDKTKDPSVCRTS
jgi:ABC-type amino acid transport substrate-binding protein